MANSTMETYQQDNTCMKCHSKSGTDFTWFIGIRAHELRVDVRSNARSFYNTVRTFNKNWLKSLAAP